MKRLFPPGLLPAILQKTLIKAGIVLLGLLAWNKWVNQSGYHTMVGYAFPVAGLVLMAMAWFRFLHQDGFFPKFRADNKPKQKKRPANSFSALVDDTSDDGEPLDLEQHTRCRMISDLLAGALFLIPGLVVMFF